MPRPKTVRHVICGVSHAHVTQNGKWSVENFVEAFIYAVSCFFAAACAVFIAFLVNNVRENGMSGFVIISHIEVQ